MSSFYSTISSLEQTLKERSHGLNSGVINHPTKLDPVKLKSTSIFWSELMVLTHRRDIISWNLRAWTTSKNILIHYGVNSRYHHWKSMMSIYQNHSFGYPRIIYTFGLAGNSCLLQFQVLWVLQIERECISNIKRTDLLLAPSSCHLAILPLSRATLRRYRRFSTIISQAWPP